MFSAFLNHLRKVTGGDFSGVRVAELHKTHGVHFHALMNRRLDVRLVRRVGHCHGIGRIHVCVADQNGDAAAKYLSKYLSKQRSGPLCESGRRARRWASFGPIKGTRICDLINDSPQWVFRRAERLPFLSYRYEHLLNRCWDYGETVFRTAWYLAKRGEIGDLCGLAQGQLEARGGGLLVERFPYRNMLTPY